MNESTGSSGSKTDRDLSHMQLHVSPGVNETTGSSLVARQTEISIICNSMSPLERLKLLAALW
jgi:hypothetical protein